MRILLITLLAISVVPTPANAQSITPKLSVTENTESSMNYHYEFRIDEVLTLADAKEVTDHIRTVFNVASEPFKHYPTFIEEESIFRFDSHVLVPQEEFASIMHSLGYEVLNFSGVTLSE